MGVDAGPDDCGVDQRAVGQPDANDTCTVGENTLDR
jgi:hypothetical protein